MPPAPLYPLRFTPIFKPAIWGGRRLAEMLPGAPSEGRIGEAWLLSDHGNDVSVIAEGPLKGTTLRELMRDRREELLGPSLAHYDTFPLLFKFIDAREPLSVQVHPNDELAQKLAAVPRGKTEAWVVLHAEPGSRIYAGLKVGVERPELERAVADGSVAECLHSFEPNEGDCIYLPAGAVHALGAGITIFEVQQTSDTTYRLFDWNRVDAKTGKPRDLHIEKALACTNFAHGPVRRVEPTEKDVHPLPVGGTPLKNVRTTSLVGSPYFSIRHWRLDIGTSFPAMFCQVIVALQGAAILEGDNGNTVLRANDIALKPAPFAMLKALSEFSFLEIAPK